MKHAQNRIELVVRRGEYEESVLSNPGDENVLAGSIGSLVEAPEHNIIETHADDMEGYEAVVILENALYGQGINAKQYDGDLILTRRLFPGDVYLLRAVMGSYLYGDPVYSTQRDNGIYVSKTGEGKFIGWVQEDFTITEDMMDVVDFTDPLLEPDGINNRTVNLLKVRIGNRPVSALYDDGTRISWTLMPPGPIVEIDNRQFRVVITFSEPVPDLELGDIIITPSDEFTPVYLLHKDEGGLVYELTLQAIHFGENYEQDLGISIDKRRVEEDTKFLTVKASGEKGQITGYWGVVYPELNERGEFAPTEAEILGISKLHEITSDMETVVCAFDLDEDDWRASGHIGDFNDIATGCAFMLTKWGVLASGIMQAGLPARSQFRPYKIDINGEEYMGYVATYPIVYNGDPYSFYFDDANDA